MLKNNQIKQELRKQIHTININLMYNDLTLTPDEKDKLIAREKKLIEMLNDLEENEKRDYDALKILEFVTGTAVSVAGIVLPLMFYNKWMEEGMTFEETGVFTSSTFRGFLSKMKPGK